MILLVIHYDREGAPQPFVAERLCDRGLVPNVQLFHRAPPSLHSAGRTRKRRNSISFAPPLHFLRLRLDYQVNRFMGCDGHISGCYI